MEEIKYLEMFRDLKINKKELSLYLKGVPSGKCGFTTLRKFS